MYLVGDFVPQKTRFSVPDFGGELVLANLEGPVCHDGLKPIDKVGPHLHSEPFELKGRWAFTLANNHLMDYGVEGMSESCAFLSKKDFRFAGAGESEADARKPMWIEESGKRIAVICCCEHQFGVAGAATAGVAAQGLWVRQQITAARTKGADVVIVSSHAGSESSKYVSPRLQWLYRTWVDAGADVIHGHHAHVPQGWEVYRGKPIFYGLGNFVVDEAMWKDNPSQLWSLAVRLDFSDTALEWHVMPIGRVPLDFQMYLNEANAIFIDKEMLAEKWRAVSLEQYNRYYKPYLTWTLRRVVAMLRHPRKLKLMRRNFGMCENHIDIIETAMSQVERTL